MDVKIVEFGMENVVVFVVEMVVGVIVGVVLFVVDYFCKICMVCDCYGVLLLFDEVMFGMGCIGYFFVCEEDGVVLDMIVIVKGLGGGY